MYKLSSPSWIVHEPEVPSTSFVLVFVLFKFKSPVYMSRHTNEVAPKSYVSLALGIKEPAILLLLGSKLPPSCGVVSPTKSVVTATKELSPLKKVDDDFVPVDPNNIDLEKITEYLNKKDVEMIKPNFGNNGSNLPASTIYKMYDEEVMQEPNEEEQAEEENFIEGGLIAQNDFNNTFLPEAQAKKLEPGGETMVNMPQVTMPNPQMPMATGQVTSQQVADLFPNDPTTIAAARRREAGNV